MSSPPDICATVKLLLALAVVACGHTDGYAERECKKTCEAMTPTHYGEIVPDRRKQPSFWPDECRCWLWARDLPSSPVPPSPVR